MPDGLWIAAASIAALLGMACLALAMDVHWRQVRDAPRTRGSGITMSASGWMLLAASLGFCLLADTATMAVLVWMMLLALAAIFLPGLLLAAGALPWWDALRVQPRAGAALAGAGAAVVGLLAGALYDPVWRSAVADGRDFVVAATAFVLLVRWRVAPWIVVLGAGLAGLALHA